MTAMATLAGASPPDTKIWEAIKWPNISADVLRLQMRIAKAVRIGRWGKAKALQWLLINSFSA